MRDQELSCLINHATYNPRRGKPFMDRLAEKNISYLAFTARVKENTIN